MKIPSRQDATTRRRGPCKLVREESGVALIIAISFLLLFSLLGTAYVQYMMVERYATDYEILQGRARSLASGGAYAAVAEIGAAIRSGQTPDPTYTFHLPVYRQKSFGMEAVTHEVRARVEDEAGRVNLNVAPRPTLEALGLSREAVRRLKSSLPRDPDEADANRRWLTSVGELVSRGILTQEEYGQLDPSLFTVYTRGGATDGTRYVNINSAPPAVLSAIFELSPEEANAMAAQRPFTSWEDAAQKAGRDPAALAFSGDDAAADANSPASLALSSRIYRIVSEAEVSLPSSISRRVRGRVEAVVAFTEDGNFRFRYWDFSTGPLEPAVEEHAAEAETAAQDTSTDEADALENGAADEPAAEASPEDPPGVENH